MATIALWMEGAHHPFEEIRAWQKEFLESLGHDVFLAEIKDLLGPTSPPADLWILGGLVYSGMGESYSPLTDDEAAALAARVSGRKPLLSLHCVVGCWDERAELDNVWDGRWDWQTSRHSPVEPFQVRIADTTHPLAQGMSDFTVTDELYYNLTPPKSSHVVLTAEYGGASWPLAWTSAGHVFFGLGHDLRSWNNKGTQTFFSNSVRELLEGAS
jgi:type 1 glutamine amidotransferase